MVDAFIGIGSNLLNPVVQVKNAISALEHLPNSHLESVSSLYSSKPQGPQDQPDFVNAVARVKTALSASSLLNALQSIELAQGKVKKRHWGERLIDLDILLYDAVTINSPELVIPHPELTNRDFVLLPLAELVEDLPIFGSIATLIDALEETFVYPMTEFTTE